MNPEVVYAGGNRYQEPPFSYVMSVCKTINGGVNWGTRRNIGSEYGICEAIAVAAGNPSIVYAGGHEEYSVKIYRSANSGDTWTDVTGNLSSLHPDYGCVYAIWVTPDDPNTLLAGTTEGVFMTADAGANWVATPLTYSIADFVYYPAKDTLYAATELRGVYYTEDEGTTWQELNDGLSCLNTLCIDMDKENGLLFVGTDGGGVYRLDMGLPNRFRIDLNNDGSVDFSDFVIFANNWMCKCSGPDWCQGCDLNTSGTVDFADLHDLVDHWLWCLSDLNSDGAVNYADFAIFASNWMDTCSEPDQCNGCDFDTNGTVDFADLPRFIDHWLW